MATFPPEHDARPAAPDPLVGRVLQGRYRVIRRIGEGGMGAVYAAQHLLIGNTVAVKMLHAKHATDARVVQRFRREAQATTHIGHHHIVSVFDFGRLEDGSLYLVMEHLDGRDLAHDVEHGGPQPLAKMVHVLSQACDALGAAHAAGIVHRDVKPENIFLIRRDDDPDFVKVLDFGISKISEASSLIAPKMTKTGSTVGTPYYMAPEQLGGSGDVDARTDIYAMGVVLFYALTGRHPFVAKTFAALAVEILTTPAPRLASFRPDLPDALQGVLDRMMAKEPASRFDSAAAVKEALRPFANVVDRPEAALASASAFRTTDSASVQATDEAARRRRPLRAFLLASGLLSLVGIGVGVYLGTRPSEPAPLPPPQPTLPPPPASHAPPEPPPAPIPEPVPTAEEASQPTAPAPRRRRRSKPRTPTPEETAPPSSPDPAPRRPQTGANNAPILR